MHRYHVCFSCRTAKAAPLHQTVHCRACREPCAPCGHVPDVRDGQAWEALRFEYFWHVNRMMIACIRVVQVKLRKLAGATGAMAESQAVKS